MIAENAQMVVCVSWLASMIRILLHDFRVIRADAAEGDTYIYFGGLKGKNICWQRKWLCNFLITTAFVTVISQSHIVF